MAPKHGLGQRFPWFTFRVKTESSSLPRGLRAFWDRASSDSDSDSGDRLLEKRGQDGEHDGRLRPQEPLWRNRWFLASHGAMLAIYLFVLALVARGKDSSARSYGMPYSPAVDVVMYEDTRFTLEDRVTDRGIYSGKPSAKLDKAWHDLLNDQNIEIEPEYIRHYGREDTAVAVPGSSGFIGTLNVYHELHCLKRIHQYMYRDHYFPNLSTHQIEINRLHNDFLRQSAMCHGDIGLITYGWNSRSLQPVASATSHQCINWDRLVRWTKARSVDMMKPGWLIHPTKGPAYPEGESDKLGVDDAVE
ncbi:Uncharacterized protein TPAR_07844 [Tolypocladium paradoxum]|uniref:Tat pathway signal sequence n=1 Tax=Tolypocladium paradoxum TaxID=94208 RepID=A0A2S4KP43_9HYPO|nr:Uncharacterized protein TPAR_07844 [Tolypocladium paradoxum]